MLLSFLLVVVVPSSPISNIKEDGNCCAATVIRQVRSGQVRSVSSFHTYNLTFF